MGSCRRTTNSQPLSILLSASLPSRSALVLTVIRKSFGFRIEFWRSTTIWRWREAYQNDFAARMDWTIRDFAHANHNPVLVVNGEPGAAALEVTVDAKQTITLDAAGSKDPDRQPLHYKWWGYEEAGLTGTNGADVTIHEANSQKTQVVINSPCRPGRIGGVPCRGEGVAHIILEVTDEGAPRLTTYRRIVLHVKAQQAGP